MIQFKYSKTIVGIPFYKLSFPPTVQYKTKIIKEKTAYEKNSIGTIGEKELKKLDALILKLSDSDLLKVEFINLEEEEAYLPPHILSVFFDSQVYVKKNTTISRQYNAENNELSDEEKVLQMIKTRSR